LFDNVYRLHLEVSSQSLPAQLSGILRIWIERWGERYNQKKTKMDSQTLFRRRIRHMTSSCDRNQMKGLYSRI
jgi:hypothetical protein